MTRKSKRASLLLAVCVVSVFAVAMFGCSDDDDKKEGEDYPAPIITDISGTLVQAGNSIIIYGQNFDTVATANIVKFNDEEGSISIGDGCSTTKLVVRSPNNCLGDDIKITVTSRGKTTEADETVNCYM